MKTPRSISAFIITFLFASVLACAAGQSHARETVGEYANDAKITTEIKSKLLAQKDMSSTSIHVETSNGVVQLSGFLSSPEQIKKAEEIARTISGVKDVNNNIQLKSK